MAVVAVVAAMENSTDEGSSTTSRIRAECASKAVAFVIKHSQKGIVSLCTNIATIMEERERLRRKNSQLKQRPGDAESTGITKTYKRGVSNVSSVCTQTDSTGPHAKTKKENPAQDGCSTTDASAHPSLSRSLRLMRRQPNKTVNTLHVLRELSEVVKPWLPLEGCLCEHCKRFAGPKACPKTLSLNLLEGGRRTIVRNKWLGTVRYVGHLDSSATCGIWVGLELEAPVGFTDGSLGNKAYFSCKPRCGVFASVSSITCMLR